MLHRMSESVTISALYQLHLVKAETARLFIPKEFKLVEAFGYTLGGFFLARYEDSPVGMFDEVYIQYSLFSVGCSCSRFVYIFHLLLVVIAGTVWNPPTSCAWAARVLVSSGDACHHGRKDVGLPSQVAKFSKRIKALPKQQKSKFGGFINIIGPAPARSCPNDGMDVEVTEINGPSAAEICNINLGSDGGLKVLIVQLFQALFDLCMDVSFACYLGEETASACLMGFMKVGLYRASSGHTEYNHNLLKYSCNIGCRVRPVRPARVSGPSSAQKDDIENSTTEELDRRNLSISIMLSKPILALEFSCLTMKVEAPIVVSHAELL
ncbi:hypothetical protein Tsubulata_004535 [Turnera subulata]|uniref:Uncharacterized protein n=1 Tax=Turnera subulata TaxID=218843 RepID=A0A9Q0JRG8_9ROSI|nr:hypothetical protein Tsubulata_004535 [Turnera subulata]